MFRNMYVLKSPIRSGFMQNMHMPGAWLDFLEVLDQLLGKLHQRGSNRPYLMVVNLVVDGSKNMSHFQPLY